MKYLYVALLTSVSLMVEPSSSHALQNSSRSGYGTPDRLQAIAGLAALTLLVSPTRTATFKDQDTIVDAAQTLSTSCYTARREKTRPCS